MLLGGDLLNQIMAASIAARELGTPFLGLYGACSTMAESLCLGAMLVDGGHMRNALCAASSHFCTAERQYRFPLEYGAQRTPTAQWTVTGSRGDAHQQRTRGEAYRAMHAGDDRHGDGSGHCGRTLVLPWRRRRRTRCGGTFKIRAAPQRIMT